MNRCRRVVGAWLASRGLSALIVIVSLALVLGGQQAIAAEEPSDPPSEAVEEGQPAVEPTRPDSVSAMVTARGTGERVEDLSQRTETTRVFANPEGSWTSEIATGPERVQDEAGEWHDIDTTLVEVDGGWAPAWAASDLVLSDGGGKTFAELTERGRDLAWKWPTVLPEPVVAENKATYAGVAPGDGDLVVTALPTGFSYDVVLNEAPTEPIELVTPVVTDGAELTMTDGGGLEVATVSGAVLAQSQAPLMWDAETDEGGDPVNIEPVETTVTETAAGGKVVLSPDQEYLTDPDTVYPVTVDPSFVTFTTGDAWLQNINQTTLMTASEELRVGSDDGGNRKARSYLNFKGVNWTKYEVLDAELRFRNFLSGSCASGAIRASMVTEAWTMASMSWSNQPTVSGSKYDDYSPAHGAANCDPASASFDVTDIVQAWSDGTANHGIRMKAVDENSSNTWRKYRSVNYTVSPTYRPKLLVEYNRAPQTIGSVEVLPGNPGYSRSLTPKFQIGASDPDGDTVTIKYEVYDSSDAQVWGGNSSPGARVLARGAVVPIPAATLLEGETYTVKAKAKDSHGLWAKSYSPVTTFKVDTTAPTVAITATGFTNGLWESEAPGSNVFTFNGPNDTASFEALIDGEPRHFEADGSGDATLSWLPTAGVHTLEIAATDKAGNTGPASTFLFGVGTGPTAGTLSAPSEALRSTGVFPAWAQAPVGAESATLRWRYARPEGTSGSWSTAEQVDTNGGSAWDGSATTQGAFSSTPELLWDATGELVPESDPEDEEYVTAPALLQVKVCFSYANSALDTCTQTRAVQLVPSAFGGSFPVTQVGPASVALFTGETSIAEVDAADTLAGVGRTFASFDTASLSASAGAFGPGWSTSLLAVAGETSAELVDHRSQDGTFVLVTAGGSSQAFTPTDPEVDPATATTPVEFMPVGIDDGSRLLWTPAESGDPATVTLTRSATSGDGSVTAWTESEETAGTWILAEAALNEDGSGDPTTSFAYDAASHEENPAYPTWIAQTAPGNSATCTPIVQEPGCRGLRLTYAGSGAATRVSEVVQVTGASGGTGTTNVLAAYDYGTSGPETGLLTSVCGPDPDPGSGSIDPLCAEYGYTTVGDRTLLASATPPGQASWEFDYDTAGRLITVTRPLDPTTNSGSGDAAWAIAYDLDAETSGLPDLGESAAGEWGQDHLPDRAFAVFGPAHVPTMDDGIPDPTSGDLAHAQVWFTDPEGAVTNTAVHANTTPDGSGSGEWLVDTTWYDTHGNITRTLDGAGRALVLAAEAGERPETALAASTLTEYSDDGRRVEAEYQPAHTATLTDGTTGMFRAGTTYTYDDEAPSLGGSGKPAYDEENGQTSFDLVVETTHAAHLPDTSESYDTSTIRSEYGPVVTGDGNGWELGAPTKTLTALGGGNWSTEITRYDTLGRFIETRQPGGAANGAGEGTDAHATVMSYYTPANADDDCKINGHSDRKGGKDWPARPDPPANLQVPRCPRPITPSTTPTCARSRAWKPPGRRRGPRPLATTRSDARHLPASRSQPEPPARHPTPGPRPPATIPTPDSPPRFPGVGRR